MGIDGGATKTLAAILDLESNSLHLALGGPSNTDTVGVQAAVRTIVQTADQAIEQAGIAPDELGTTVLAVAGVDTDAFAGHVRSARPGAWIVINDVVGAWATATGGGPGVAAISGTGSNVFGVGPGGRAWRAGGWGHVLGDEGSGYWVGVQSIKAALRDRDASGPKTALSDAAVAFFGVPSLEALAMRIYSKPMTKGEIAAFATQTAKVAERGDAVARELYERGALELCGQIAAVIQETGLCGGPASEAQARGGDGPRPVSVPGDSPTAHGEWTGEPPSFPVGLIGSGFRAGAVLVEPIARAVREYAPAALVSVVETAPVSGSLLLAARAGGRSDALELAELLRLIDAAVARER
jgi:N-acetylglucosamine kinase-like BadF-type ATPase